MVMEKVNQVGYYTLTYKVRFYTNYANFLKLTAQIYNKLILRYYQLLFKYDEFLKLSNQNCLRKLEEITIKDKNGNKPNEYIEIEVPAYLRRSAINQAIGYRRTYQKLLQTYEEKTNSKEKP